MKPSTHAYIVRRAFEKNNTMSPEALKLVVKAAINSDWHPFAAERHFDNAPDTEAICSLWKRGMNRFLNDAVSACRPLENADHFLKDREGALTSFGAACHALADFFAHTNYIELTEKENVPLPPLFGTLCRAEDFPPTARKELHSGSFGFKHGCADSHHSLNKDSEDKGKGAMRSASGFTYHHVAVQSAIEGSQLLWIALHNRIVSAYGSHSHGAASTIIAKLAWGDIC